MAPPTISIPVTSRAKVFGSGTVGGVVAVTATVCVHCVCAPTAVLIIARPVIANGAVTLGPPMDEVGPEHVCTGGALAGKVQGFVSDTAVAPGGPGVSSLSLRSHPMNVSVPVAPTVMVPECVAESEPTPTGVVNPLTPKSI